MGLLEALIYAVTAFFIIPHNRDEIPFKQFGLDINQFIKIFTEFGLYEASTVELFKAVACASDYDYSLSKGWCHELETEDEEPFEGDPNSKYWRNMLWRIL